MSNESENAPIFYPDLGEFSTPEPGQAEGLTLKPYEYSKTKFEGKLDDQQRA